MIYLTLEDWITSSGKYPERASSKELTDEVKANATKLVNTINSFLKELDWKDPISISSGFRPNSINSKIKNAAKKSLHLTGLALDIVDPSSKLKEAIKSKSELLATFGLWMEAPDSTPTWCHLDLGTRTDRPIRIFNP